MNLNCSSLETIFQEITAERKRQDELHPWDNLEILTTFPDEEFHHDDMARKYKAFNDMAERDGMAFIDCLTMEEHHETFSETDEIKRENEALQAAALYIKFVQWSREKRGAK